MSSRISIALVFTIFACGGEPTTTMTGGGSTGGSTGGATGIGSTGDDPTGGATSTTGTSDTGGTGGGTESASGSDTVEPTTAGATTEPATTTEGGGTGGQGSGMACAKWYSAIAESYEPICECEVQKGTYETVEECMMMLAPSEDCACSIFAESPETAEILKCYEKAAQAKTECLGELNLCLDNVPLDPCIMDELQAYLECGMPPAEVCEQLKTMCGEAAPPVCG